ncbi:hypothetical protein OIV83_005774 [Microbotryomycetes sp. JL201]|nr:hypothetical protein OIV83_005774 [Microbotryomycetes sp. JL201]
MARYRVGLSTWPLTFLSIKYDAEDAQGWQELVQRCERLNLVPGPPNDFDRRSESDRYVQGTPRTLIKNATVWTGHDDPERRILHAHDVLLDKGLIIDVGKNLSSVSTAEDVYNAHGAFVTFGIVDMHSHISVDSFPGLSGSSDVNSVQNPVLPHLRSLDGINTHDLAFKRTVAGGVVASLILPGSANNIGGQAFVIKLRPTRERTPDSLVLEMPFNIPIPGNEWKKGDPPRWRHMKMACGENIKRTYKQTRLDLSWNFRSAFEQARTLKQNQDTFCHKVRRAHSRGQVLPSTEREFPDELKWEALVDVLRGKVKVNTHCYEATDLAAFVRHSHEFQFPITAFHHAHEAYLVPDLLKTAYNNTPAVAVFATQARYKREAWRGTEYAPFILDQSNLTVIMKSDHPVLDSRYLLFEAQQAHHFGLDEQQALKSVTVNPANVAGFGHRLGKVEKGFDADVVIWDRHPLRLGATPKQVWIDGIAQLARSHCDEQHVVRNVDMVETVINEAPRVATVPKHVISMELDDDGSEVDQPLTVSSALFRNVKEILLNDKHGRLQDLTPVAATGKHDDDFDVLVQEGRITCIGNCANNGDSTIPRVDLQGGSLWPPAFAYGPAIGLTEMISEKSTTDNPVYDPLFSGELSTTQQFWGQQIQVKAVDGLELEGKHVRIAHQMGLTKAITAPMGNGFFRGVSVAFRTGAKNVLEDGAILSERAALHVTIGHYKGTQTPSISTEIAELRRLLLAGLEKDESTRVKADYFSLAAHGKIPLVINAWKADVMATLIRLKTEIESEPNATAPLRWIIHGGQEAHLVAHELASADIAVILSPPRPFPETWDERRAVTGPPLSERNAVNVLHNAGVKLGLGVPEEWTTRTLFWEAGWAYLNSVSSDNVTRSDAVKWLTSNFEDIFELNSGENGRDLDEFVAHETPAVPGSSSTTATGSNSGKRKLVEPKFDVNSYKSIKLDHESSASSLATTAASSSSSSSSNLAYGSAAVQAGRGQQGRVRIQDVPEGADDVEDDERDAQSSRDFAPGGDADYFQEEDEDGRFFGGGLSSVQKQVLNLMDGDDPEKLADANADQGGGELDAPGVRRQLLAFEKAIDENRKLRTKFVDDPTKFVDSEFNLIQAVQGLMLLSTNPILTFPILIDLNTTESLADLMSHENPDVVMAVIEVLEEWLDPDSLDDREEDEDGDVDAQQSRIDALKALVEGLRKAGLIDLAVATLDRLNEEDESERAGVFHTMGLIENLVSLDNSVALTLLDASSPYLAYLVKRLAQDKKPTEYDQNRFYAAEMLALVLSLPLEGIERARSRIGDEGHVDTLLKTLSTYRKRDPKDGDETEFMENLFDALCSSLTEPNVKMAFLEGEGIELMCLMLKDKKLSKTRAIKTLDYALQSRSGIPLCEQFVEALGLKTLFAAFMGKGNSAKKGTGLTPTDIEHVLSIISSLLTSLASDSVARLRLLSKFVEQSYSKIDRLIELRNEIEQRVTKGVERTVQVLGDELDQDELYIEKLDKGLFSLQLVDYAIAWICMEDDGARDHVRMLLSRESKSLADVVFVLSEYRDNINVQQEDLDDFGNTREPDKVVSEEGTQAAQSEMVMSEGQESRDILQHLIEYLKSIM